jgi:hypothetical protein
MGALEGMLRHVPAGCAGKVFLHSVFPDRGQPDRAVEVLKSQQEPKESIHGTAYCLITEAVFTCRDDI